MGMNDFDYEIPSNFEANFMNFLVQNEARNIASHIRGCQMDFNDIGYAHYAGMSGNVWDKHALDITVNGQEDDISFLRKNKVVLKEKIQTFLRPARSGLLVRNINFIVDSVSDVYLPEETEITLETLSADIRDAMSKKEPALALDRLHTYSTRYLRRLCDNHHLPTNDGKGKNHPLHSLVGALANFYKNNNMFQSDFMDTSLKMSISVMEKFNHIRNDRSYAHDNEILNDVEAEYVISIITAILKLFEEVEKKCCDNGMGKYDF